MNEYWKGIIIAIVATSVIVGSLCYGFGYESGYIDAFNDVLENIVFIVPPDAVAMIKNDSLIRYDDFGNVSVVMENDTLYVYYPKIGS